MGLVLTAICYLSARIGDHENTARRTLVWIGGLALLPCAGIAIAMATEGSYSYRYRERSALPFAIWLVCWLVALLGPLLLAMLLRGRAAWINLLWIAWTYALLLSAHYSHSYESPGRYRDLWTTAALYALCAVGAVGLVAWGLYERRKERLYLGIAAFAISVLFFYFDSFMDKLGRSASLLILGTLCLAGGYVLEITRRRLVARMESSRSQLKSVVSQ